MTKTRSIGRHEVPKSPWMSPKVAAAASPGRGMGLFAAEAIAAGDVVLVWGGDSYTDEGCAARARSEGRGTMQWDVDLFSCEGDGHAAFAINHSCDPNVWLVDPFHLTAMRDIAAGEELAMEYATLCGEDDASAAWDCCCGATACRGRISGADWKLEYLQARYAGHFTPILRRRIAKDSSGPV